MKALAVLQLSLPPTPASQLRGTALPVLGPAWDLWEQASGEAPHPPVINQSQPSPGFSPAEPPDGSPGPRPQLSHCLCFSQGLHWQPLRSLAWSPPHQA